MDEEYDWDEWDRQATDYTNNQDYGGDYNTDDAVGGTGEGQYYGASDSGGQGGDRNWSLSDEYSQDSGTAPQYDWGSWDKAANEYSTSQDFYKANPTYDPSSKNYFKDVNTGTEYWKNDAGKYAGYQEKGGDFTPYESGGSSGSSDWMSQLAKALFGSGGSSSSGSGGSSGSGSSKNVLESILSGEGGSSGGSGGILSSLLTYLASNEENKSADEYEKQAQDQLDSSRAYMDPFAGQRGQYQDLLKSASDRLEGIYNAPTSSAMYTQAQNEANRRIMRGQSKNRMGMATNRMMGQMAPELMKNALADARDTMKSYITPSGADIKPSAVTELTKMLLDAQKQSGTDARWSALAKILKNYSS
jgi:hypothetical protein